MNDSILKSEPVRVAYVVLSAVIAILAIVGVSDGDLVQTLGQIVVLIGGGEAVRSRVTPERAATSREHAAYNRGRRAR